MALATECQTPGAQFHTMIVPGAVMVRVDFPRAIELDENAAALVEANIHNALELVLAPLFGRP